MAHGAHADTSQTIKILKSLMRKPSCNCSQNTTPSFLTTILALTQIITATILTTTTPRLAQPVTNRISTVPALRLPVKWDWCVKLHRKMNEQESS